MFSKRIPIYDCHLTFFFINLCIICTMEICTCFHENHGLLLCGHDLKRLMEIRSATAIGTHDSRLLLCLLTLFSNSIGIPNRRGRKKKGLQDLHNIYCCPSHALKPLKKSLCLHQYSALFPAKPSTG